MAGFEAGRGSQGAQGAPEPESRPVKAEQLAADAEQLAARLRARSVWVSADGRIRADAAAELLDVAPKTLRNWRCEGRGPDYYEATPGRFTYRLTDLVAFIERSRVVR